nr:ribonuclease H-like domain-containing protein [Tanacetum cinerariifolium]
MDQQYPTVAKIPILDTGKFEQWQFRIQQYLQHEHYALWEVIEFGDSYKVPTSTTDTTTTDTTSGETVTKSGRAVTLIAEDIQKKKTDGSSQNNIDDKGYWDSRCSRHMTGNISYLSNFDLIEDMGLLVNEDARLLEKELSKPINLKCIVLGRDFKLLDDANILLRTPRKHNMYSINLNNIVPHKDLTCLVAKASADECMLWHRRL